MKKICFIVYTVLFFAFLSCSGDIFDNIKEHASEEKVYVTKFDDPVAYAGLERVEINLLDAGRIPSSEINLAKAVKTVVEYDDKVLTYDEVKSWVNITGLTVPKMYRFTIYNIDEYGNKSIPVEISSIPYTSEEFETLLFPNPLLFISPTAAEISWPNGLSSGFFDYVDLEYKYTDINGNTIDTITGNSFTMLNLEASVSVPVHLRCRIIPKVGGTKIIDTLVITHTLNIAPCTEAEYLASREDRVIQAAFIEGTESTDGKITWGGTTTHLAFSEIRYKTNSGNTNTLRILPSTNSFVCPDAKAGELLEYRSVFNPTSTADTFYRPWKTYQYPLIYKYDRSEWTGVSRNGNHGWGDGKGGQPELLFDGDAASGWHSRVGSPLPQCIVIDMKQPLSIDRIMFQPPYTNGWCYIDDIEIYLSNTEMKPEDAPAPLPSWGNPVFKGKYPYGSVGTNWDIDFPDGSSGQYCALIFPNSTSGNTYISAMEFVVYGRGN
jgi:hypothetical protein